METGIETNVKPEKKYPEHPEMIKREFLKAYADPEADLELFMEKCKITWTNVMRWKQHPKYAAKFEAARSRLRHRAMLDVERAAALGASQMLRRVKQAIAGGAELEKERESILNNVVTHARAMTKLWTKPAPPASETDENIPVADEEALADLINGAD